MNKIRVLPDSLANKIAAGEVVERPASIVKELIENSIDAGASRIEVAVEAGGRQLIRISDDGEGMTRDDALVAFERHATSKISTAEDLESIITLGFRGEALASIASVAKVRLRTQTVDALVGTEIEISGGRILAVRDVPFSRGAEFEIRDLFFNVPARRKFLKTDSTESYHIANLVTHYALSNPALSFTLSNNGRESIRVSPAADLRERAYQLFGEDFIGDLIEVSLESGEMRVRGYVSSPSTPRTNRDSQYFFINGRYVRDKVIGRALSEAYRATMPSGAYPAAMLFVELPPREVDVNVHPAKTEVRFVRATLVFDLVRDATRGAIAQTRAAVTPFEGRRSESFVADLRPPVQSIPAQRFHPSTEEEGPFRVHIPGTADILPGESPHPVQIGRGAPPNVPEPEQLRIDTGLTANSLPSPEPELAPSSWPSRLGCLGARGSDSSTSQLKPAGNLTLVADEVSPLGQLHHSFIIAADRSGLLLVDQHVAHERILFEQHWEALRRQQVEVQRVLIPETVDLTPAQAAVLDQVLPRLEENGFEIGHLSGRTISINSVPAILSPGVARQLLSELLEAVEIDRRTLSLDEIRAEIAASLACRAAVKINMPLSAEKMRWLIDQLLTRHNPATCPHGRPIILRISSREIEKGFQR